MFSNETFVPGIDPTMISHGAALAMLGTIFVGGASLFAALVLRLAGHPTRAVRAALIAPATLALYGLALVGVSLMSRDRVYGRGEEKYFCELDCHLAYAVLDVRALASLGDAVDAPRARGRYWVVTVRARFDSTTIAPWRPRDVPVFPDARELVVFDRSGRPYPPAASAQAAMERAGAALSPLLRPLVPGQSALTRVVFDLPARELPARVLLHDTELFHRVVIGDEGSFLHGQASWGL
jgi:hypothetical protein